MNKNREQDYVAKHKKIRQNLAELTMESNRPCVDVHLLSSQVGMDIRTVRSHLRVMEVDMIGVFIDSSKKQFCTKEGISLLANILKMGKESGE